MKKQVPITIEDKRAKNPDIVLKEQKDILGEENIDEFSNHF